jgi:exodeoxyribonuclease III
LVSLGTMLIATWNVASLRARMPRLLELLSKHEPDIVLLQETKCTSENFPTSEVEEAGYGAVHYGTSQWAGVAILSKSSLPATDPQYGLPGEPVPQEARWVEATVGGLRVISTYVHNGRSVEHPEFQNKLVFLEAAGARAEAWKADNEAPVVIGGDFNVAPADSDAYDVTKFETHVTPAERAALSDLQRQGGLTDAYRKVHPDTPQFTWWDYRAGSFHKNLGLRIDLLLVDDAISSQISECAIDRDLRKGTKPSDHAPLFVRLGQAAAVTSVF